jgi:lysophospholipase L1-like esterase
MSTKILAHRCLLLVAVMITSAALFGAAELGVRVRQHIKFGSLLRIEDTYTVDAKSGLRIPVPGGSFGGIHINSLGFRSPELEVPKSASTVRIAFLGSSTTYCAEVSSNENTWPYLVAQKLQARWPDVTVDYINAGVPGYSLESSVLNLKSRVAPLDPDVIVIYEGHNDLSGNSFHLAVKEGLVSKPTEQNLSWPAKYSLLWYLVEKNLLIMSKQLTAREVEGKLRFDKEALTAPFRRDLKDLVQASKRVASLVVLVTFSTQLRSDQTTGQQTRAAATSLYYMPYMSINGLIEAYASYNQVVRQVAEETGSLIITDENSIPGDAQHFVDSIHFTDKGSRFMSERVAHALLESAALQEIFSVKSANPEEKVTSGHLPQRSQARDN